MVEGVRGVGSIDPPRGCLADPASDSLPLPACYVSSVSIGDRGIDNHTFLNVIFGTSCRSYLFKASRLILAQF